MLTAEKNSISHSTSPHHLSRPLHHLFYHSGDFIISLYISLLKRLWTLKIYFYCILFDIKMRRNKWKREIQAHHIKQWHCIVLFAPFLHHNTSSEIFKNLLFEQWYFISSVKTHQYLKGDFCTLYIYLSTQFSLSPHHLTTATLFHLLEVPHTAPFIQLACWAFIHPHFTEYNLFCTFKKCLGCTLSHWWTLQFSSSYFRRVLYFSFIFWPRTNSLKFLLSFGALIDHHNPAYSDTLN